MLDCRPGMKSKRLPHSWRSRVVYSCFFVYLFTSTALRGTGDNNETGFHDSPSFQLDTHDPNPMDSIGFGDSGGFELNTGGHDGTLQSGIGDTGGFELNTQNSPGGIGDMNNTGFADSGGFQLDTADGNATSSDSNQTGFANSGGFALDTRNPNPMDSIGFADSGGFELNTGGHDGTERTGFSDSGAFALDTTDNTGNGTDQNNTGFADSNTFALDTTDGNSSGSNTGNEQNASVSGTVSYQGVVPGPAIIWALDTNDTVIDHAELPDGNGSYSLSVPIGQGYDFKVFIDGNENGYPTTGEAWKHFADWNSTTNSYNLTQVDSNLTGVDFSLWDSDFDSDGFLNWHEYLAGTQEQNASSIPPLEFGMLAHWSFDETNGTILHDSSGNDLNGTLNGFNNPWSPGRKGGSLRFDGVDDHITFAGITQLNDIRPLSFSGWLKLDHNGSGYVFAKRSLSQGYWRFFASGPSKNWLVRSTTGSAPALQTAEATPFFHWQHITLTWNGLLTGQNTKLYIDGSEQMSITRTAGTGQIVSDVGNLFTLGNRPEGNSSYFKGWMDDFRIWNRVITQNEIQALYQGAPDTNATVSGNITNNTSVPGPIILWVYDESGTKVAQQTLSGGPGPYSFSLTAGHSYDIKAFADGNQDGELNPSIGEPYTHFGNWNGNGHDLLPVDGNQSNVNLTLNYETDQDNDGFSLWTETQAGSNDNNSDSLPNNPPADLNSTAPLHFAENLPIGSAIGEFNATDPDANTTLTYHFVSGENNNTFFTLEQNGTLKTATVFDFESNASSYLIQVSVKDEYNSTIEGNFTVFLLDTLENAPPSFQSDGNLTVSENTTFVYEFNATDPDGDVLTYSILHGPDAHLFDMNRTTGILSFNNSRDFENPEDNNSDNVYEISIKVADQETNSSPQLGWRESHITGDSDSGISSSYTYTTAVNINGSNHTVNGVNFIGRSANSGSGWSITQGFTTGHGGNQSSVNGQIGTMLSNGFRYGGGGTIKINELTHGETYTFTLFNQAWGSQRLIHLSLSDQLGIFSINQDKYHSSPQDGLLIECTYIANGTEVDFNIDANDTTNLPHLYAFSNRIATAENNSTQSGLTSTLNLNVQVTDVFENAPPSFQSDGNLTVQENTTFVYEFNATDPDGDVLTYSILHGPDASLFDLNQSSGALTFFSPKDYEAPEDNNTDNVYQLTIQVADSGAPVSLNLNIEVTDVFENAPPSFQSDGNLTVSENTTFVYEFNATDPDGDVLTYSILHGPDASLFDLNQSSGALTFFSPKDYEAPEDNNTD